MIDSSLVVYIPTFYRWACRVKGVWNAWRNRRINRQLEAIRRAGK